jgi:hypothetical protein
VRWVSIDLLFKRQDLLVILLDAIEETHFNWRNESTPNLNLNTDFTARSNCVTEEEVFPVIDLLPLIVLWSRRSSFPAKYLPHNDQTYAFDPPPLRLHSQSFPSSAASAQVPSA